ncbi:hypothetical protein ABZ370_08270 [Streptomyces sp. NPDC005962]|uniref:hypothetical protein n=1 Tax=Streptomyces sp. NPDC005962 TaxID=3154466 RepID=UPI0033F4C821
MEFYSARALMAVIGDVLKREEARTGCKGIDLDVRVAYKAVEGENPENSVPVVLRGSDGKVWVTAYNCDSELPEEVERDLGVTSEMLIDMDEAEMDVRFGFGS